MTKDIYLLLLLLFSLQLKAMPPFTTVCFLIIDTFKRHDSSSFSCIYEINRQTHICGNDIFKRDSDIGGNKYTKQKKTFTCESFVHISVLEKIIKIQIKHLTIVFIF